MLFMIFLLPKGIFPIFHENAWNFFQLFCGAWYDFFFVDCFDLLGLAMTTKPTVNAGCEAKQSINNSFVFIKQFFYLHELNHLFWHTKRFFQRGQTQVVRSEW